MELTGMLVICLAAMAAAFIVGERIDRTVFLKLDSKNPERVQTQLEELIRQGILFAYSCHQKGIIKKSGSEELIREYVLNTMEVLYKTKIVIKKDMLEQMIQEQTQKG